MAPPLDHGGLAGVFDLIPEFSEVLSGVAVASSCGHAGAPSILYSKCVQVRKKRQGLTRPDIAATGCPEHLTAPGISSAGRVNASLRDVVQNGASTQWPTDAHQRPQLMPPFLPQRTSFFAIRFPLLLLPFLLTVPTGAQQLRRPEAWRLAMDPPGRDSVLEWVAMPPGWHITTGPGAVMLYDPANTVRGRYTLETEIHLFPGESTEGYGVFIGGSALDGTQPSSVSFLVRRDGRASIERRSSGQSSDIFAAAPSAAVRAHPGGDSTVKNILRVSVERDSVVFEANGSRVTAFARGDLPLDGVIGFRVGRGINLHISRLDLTHRLAPVPTRR